MHPLDNVIWNALTTRQANFAEGAGPARRFVPDVTLLSALEAETNAGFESMATLVGDAGTCAIFMEHPYEPRPGWEWIGGAPLLQMICEKGNGIVSSGYAHFEFVPLGPNDSSEMLNLTSLTKPGPFGPRTHELGTYIGVRVDGRLAAMAGERLKVPGYTEVSAVCTHPDFLGRGYAGALMMHVMRGIRERGETPFLHVREGNARAISLYERLGFRARKSGHFAVLRRQN